MVGNDVVDLRDPETVPGAGHPRFDERVLTPGERAKLAEDPARLRWIFWASKEAAYKLARRIEPGTVFSPVTFEVDLDAAVVRWQQRRFDLAFDVDAERVHAVVTLGGPATLTGVGLTGADLPGDAVRRLALGAIAAHLGIPAEGLVFEQTDRIPRLRSAGRILPIDVSLSHHGRHVAFAAL